MNRFVQDFRHALSACCRAPLVSTLAIIAFALGIGVTTGVFSIFYSVLLKPLPYPLADELVVVYDTQPACTTCPASFPKYTDWKNRNQVFSAMGGSTPASLVLSGRGDSVQVAGMQATASIVDVFGVQPALGRWFSEAEDQPNGPQVVVLSNPFWTRQFAGAGNVVGQTISLNGVPYGVIGVMPQGFSHRGGELFVPLARALDPATRTGHFLLTYARLETGVPIERAATEMRALGESLAREFGGNHGVDVVSYREVVSGRCGRNCGCCSGRCSPFSSSVARTSRTCCSPRDWRGAANSVFVSRSAPAPETSPASSSPKERFSRRWVDDSA